MNIDDLGIGDIAKGWPEKVEKTDPGKAEFHTKCLDLRHKLFTDNYERESNGQLRSSLDVIEDSQLAIDSYFSESVAASEGACYTKVYGILQVLYVQQDAVRHLFESLGRKWPGNSALGRVRDIRNRAVGHPTNMKRKGKLSFHFISRATLTQERFQLISELEDSPDKYEDVEIRNLIDIQGSEMKRLLFEELRNSL